MNANFFKRFLAYLVDIIIFGVIVTLSLNLFSNSYKNNIEVLNDEIVEINELVIEEEITFKNYIYRYAELIMQIDQMQALITILNVIFALLLFVFIPFFLHGRTIGMFITGIKVVKENDDSASLNLLFFRSLLIYSLGYLLIILGIMYFVPSICYLITSSILIILEFLLVIISGFMILYRNDRRSLLDIITKTKVVKI